VRDAEQIAGALEGPWKGRGGRPDPGRGASRPRGADRRVARMRPSRPAVSRGLARQALENSRPMAFRAPLGLDEFKFWA